jgi:hypothetical protein
MAQLGTFHPSRRSFRRWGAWLLFPGLCLAAAFASAAPGEYQLKAVFLFNFVQFVEWPEAAFASADAPIVIGVLGTDPFGPVLDEIVRDEKIAQRPLVVKRCARLEEAKSCHLLFISGSEESRFDQIIAQLRGRAILTVGDFDHFARRGGMIRFMSEKNRIRLRINLESARAAGLRLSSKLLRPAEIVGGTENTP